MMGGYGGYGGYNSGGNLLGFGMMVLFGLVLLVGIILLVVWVVRSSRHQSGQSGGDVMPRPPMQAPTDDACAIAKVRYAKGEITREQYEEICRTLGS
jgi:putative membrane protein